MHTQASFFLHACFLGKLDGQYAFKGLYNWFFDLKWVLVSQILESIKVHKASMASFYELWSKNGVESTLHAWTWVWLWNLGAHNLSTKWRKHLHVIAYVTCMLHVSHMHWLQEIFITLSIGKLHHALYNNCTRAFQLQKFRWIYCCHH